MCKSSHLTNICAKLSLLFLAIAINACNTLKRVGENELLLRENTIYADGEEINDEAIQSLIVQEPNTRILGYPLRLNLYNLAKQNPDSSYNAWLHRKEHREERLVRLLSKKQVNRLGESFLVSGLSEWLKKIGEAPVVVDTTKARRTLERLSAYYGSKGYFNNNTTYIIDTLTKKKRASLDYRIDLGKPFYIDSISHRIASKAIDSIYQESEELSFVKRGDQFDLSQFARSLIQDKKLESGRSGEEKTYKYEKKKLKNLGIKLLPKKWGFWDNKLGYDVKSWDENSSAIYIEA